MSSAPGHRPGRGVLAALGAYLAWGLLPVYWHQMAMVDAVELIAHRLCWTLAFTLPLLWWRGGLGGAIRSLGSGRALALSLFSSLLLTCNWLTFVWAVNHGHVLESSLGYFLVPLVNVALGRFVLHERLRPRQWLAIALAAAGVGLQIVQVGRLPWIALLLAATFGWYGLLRKKSAHGPLVGLTVETLLLAPLAGAFLLWRAHEGGGALGHAPIAIQVWVLSTGAVTAIPLLYFAYGARRLRLTTLGLLQYVAPTAQFALGVWVFHEPFRAAQATSFVLIWAGLTVYTADVFQAFRPRPAEQPIRA
ncbi:MAG: EamA family transporter RarD [Opitutales bacterium]